MVAGVVLIICYVGILHCGHLLDSRPKSVQQSVQNGMEVRSMVEQSSRDIDDVLCFVLDIPTSGQHVRDVPGKVPDQVTEGSRPSSQVTMSNVVEVTLKSGDNIH